jgi:hypothetical protein
MEATAQAPLQPGKASDLQNYEASPQQKQGDSLDRPPHTRAQVNA